jgi:hypothetical protein
MKWTAWVRITSSKTNRKEKDLVTHNHDNVATKQVGLSQDLKDFIEGYFPKGKKREATMSEQLLLENLKAVLLKTPDRKHIGTDDDKWETFKVQVRNYLRYQRSKNDDKLRSVQDIISMCKDHEMLIPESYVPRSNYKTPKELADALRVSSGDEMFLSQLGYEQNLIALMERLDEEFVKNKKRLPWESEKQKYRQDVLAAFVVCSPATLLQLMRLAKLPNGWRVLYRDGTHGACIDGSKLIVHLTADTKYRKSASTVTSSPVVTHYILSPEESLASTIAGDLWMQDICKRLFGVKLELDYAESDGADGFISGAIIAWKTLKSVLNCTFHVTKLIGSAGNSTLKKKFNSDGHKNTAPHQACRLQFCKTQEQFNACMNLLCDEWIEQGETNAADYIRSEHGTYPHNKWWYCAAGKQEKRCNFVLQILQYFSPLLLFGRHLLFVLAGATPGIYPTGNIAESHQRIKGTSSIPKKIDKNCSMSNLVSTQLPNLIASEGQRMSTLVAGRKDPRPEPSALALVSAMLFRANIDLSKKVDNAGNLVCYFANTRRRIGFPVASRLLEYHEALEGKSELFIKRIGSDRSKVAAEMIAATRSICRITVSQDKSGKTIVMGDCEDCIKKLGYDCPGVLIVKDVEKLDGGIPLSKRWLVQDQLGRKNGTQDASGLGGLEKPKSKRKRTPGVFVEDRKELFKSSLTVAGTKKFRDFCFMLQLHRHFGAEEKPFAGKPDSYFLELILKFDECPSCFRGCCCKSGCGDGSRKGQAKRC